MPASALKLTNPEIQCSEIGRGDALFGESSRETLLTQLAMRMAVTDRESARRQLVERRP